MEFDEIVTAFSCNQLERLVRKHRPERLEPCWPELIENDYDRKEALVVALIRAGLDCEWRNDRGQTPTELALAKKNRKLVAAMLQAEMARFGEGKEQRMVYRLVRRGSVELLEMFFEMQQTGETDQFRMVSFAMEEVHVKGVFIEKEMQLFCYRIILTMFYRTHKVMKLTAKQRSQHVRKRIEVICQEVEFLQSYGTDSFTNIDNNFLTSLSIISENLFVADLMWKHPTWTALQPSKIVYLIEIFEQVIKKRLPDLGFIIDKQLLLDMLSMLSTELQRINLRDYDGIEMMERDLVEIVRVNNIREQWKSKYPQVKLTKHHLRIATKRDTKALEKAGINTKQQAHLIGLIRERKNLQQLQELWAKKYPKVRLGQRAVVWAGKNATRAGPFRAFSRRTRYVLKTINKMYGRAKSYYSLTVMLAHIQAIYDIPLTHGMAAEFGFAAFQRIVQIVGEFSKNTKQTPNLQSALHEQIAAWQSPSLLEVYQHRRNAATHGLSLTEVNFRVLCNSGDVHVNVLLKYCEMVQVELRKSYPHLKYYQQGEFIKIVRGCFGRIRQLKSVEQRKSFAAMMATLEWSDWPYAGAGLFDFGEIYCVIHKLLNSKQDERWHHSFNKIKQVVQQAEQIHLDIMTELEKTREQSLLLIENCWKYSDYNVLDRSLQFKLKLPREYYAPGRTFGLLREANKLLAPIIESQQYSKDAAEHMIQLNRLMANKVSRYIELRKAHQINQFVPHQNESYTERLLEALSVKDLNREQFYQIHDALDSRVYDPLSKQHEVGMFAVEGKFNVIKRTLEENGVNVDAQLLIKCQEQDRQFLQHLLDQMLDALYKLSREKVDSKNKYFGARYLATQYGLLEICAILSHTEPFQSNFDFFNTPMPLVAGRYLRNTLSHDFMLCKSASVHNPEILQVTIEVLYQKRTTLLNTTKIPCEPLPHFGELTEKYKRRKRMAQEQNVPIKGEIDKILHSRLDIYGQHFFIWRGNSNCYHNLLDVVLYYYQQDAIAYIEKHSQHKEDVSASSVFSVLWNRLRFSDLLGWPLQHIVKLYSIGGMNTGFSHADGLAEDMDKIAQHLASHLRVPMENFGYDPPEQIEKILCYFLLVKRLDKFVEFFRRYGEKFDFIKYHKLYADIPDVVDKLGEFLPWGSVEDQRFSIIHSFCAVNNVQALKSAFKRSSPQQFCIPWKNGATPIAIAVANSSFEAVRFLLECRKPTKQMDPYVLCWITETHQNDLLKYFIPALQTDQSQAKFTPCALHIAATANIDAYNFLRQKLSTTAFRRVCPDDSMLISTVIATGNKHTHLKQFLAVTKQNSDNNDPPKLSSSLSIDSTKGRFKYTNFLLSNGAAVDFAVIKAAVTANCFKRVKWLLKKSQMKLTDSQHQEICHIIVANSLALRMFKHFMKLVTIPPTDLPRMFELTLQRDIFGHTRYLCELFPTTLQNYNRPSRAHPVEQAIDSVHRKNSLAQDKPFLLFLIQQCGNFPQQEWLLLEALQLCDLQIVQTLLDAGVPVDVEQGGFTPLSFAAHRCVTYPNAAAYAIFELLLKKGANTRHLVLQKTKYLETVRLLELLIEHTRYGADSPELLIILLNVQVVASDRVMQALLRKYKFLAASLSFRKDERLVIDPQFKIIVVKRRF